MYWMEVRSLREDMTEKNRSGEKAVCLQAKKCGGCQYIGVPYEEQLRKKQMRPVSASSWKRSKN